MPGIARRPRINMRNKIILIPACRQIAPIGHREAMHLMPGPPQQREFIEINLLRPSLEDVVFVDEQDALGGSLGERMKDEG